MTAIHRRTRTTVEHVDGSGAVPMPRPEIGASASGGSSGLRDLGIEPRAAVVTLFACCTALTIAGVVAAWFEDQQQWKYQLFELNTEANVPTWFSAAQLALAALAAWSCGAMHRSRGLPGVGSWRLVAASLLFVSADEVAQFHEQISFQVRNSLDTDGVLRFAWVIPYGVAAVVVAALLFRWWQSLPRVTRRSIVVCAVAFVVGALGLELIEGAYESWLGKDFGLRALTVVEEALEMFAVAAVIGVFLRHLCQVSAMAPVGESVRAAGTASGRRPASD